ncbi:HD domain-containing phosphohydrolase [Roseospirillum parvum]|uniref:PAS domain S-box-containing protein n=1 Tax=Roseospirillum parvum TaxID=83401 RepID=A0A1G7U0D2_9PROT|nr:HD domain-containing phosphohydrolase [Roseospirillum parvum]SDG40887.1 PAS domain S-box-containing protein [Roseospirillum parvum]
MANNTEQTTDSAPVGSAESPEEAREARTARLKMAAIAGALGLVAVIGVALVFHFVNQERERELQNWQVRLGIVADSRAADVRRWLDEQFDVLSGLADNASLQLYAMGLMGSGESAEETMEGGYLRNLLEATAQQSGFAAEIPEQTVNANIAPSGKAGLAILDPRGSILLATRFMPPPPEGFATVLAQAAEGRPALYDIRPGAGGAPTIGFAVPLFAVQEGAGSEPIGFVVGLRPADKALFSRLRQPGETSRTAQSYLVRARGAVAEYLSPLADGTAPLQKTMALDTADLAAAFALKSPGGFGIRRDYASAEVLVTGRAIAGTPWTLVRSIATSEALAATDQRLRTLLIVFLVVIAAVLVGAIALWRHGTSMRFAQMAARHKVAAEKLSNYMKFMRVVTDGQPTAIAAVDREGRYTFANKGATWQSGLEPEQMLGKTLVDVMGPFQAKKFMDLNEEVIDRGQPRSSVQTLEGAPPRIVKSEHIPLAGDRDHPPSALMVIEDITELMDERAKRESTMRDLVSTLVSLVDSRDPYSANHSARVAQVASAVAQEMGEDDQVVQTVDIAGNLMNLGKVLVPTEILTKTERLTDEEMRIVRDSMVKTADLLGHIAFDLPVSPTLRQLQERWDGAGYPDGLSGEQIIVGARIVAVANAFVSMVSPRSFRAAMPFAKASSILLEDAGTRFDRRPIAALINYVENRDGAAQWAHFAEIPETPAG